MWFLDTEALVQCDVRLFASSRRWERLSVIGDHSRAFFRGLFHDRGQAFGQTVRDGSKTSVTEAFGVFEFDGYRHCCFASRTATGLAGFLATNAGPSSLTMSLGL